MDRIECMCCKVHAGGIVKYVLQGACRWDRVQCMCCKVHAGGTEFNVCAARCMHMCACYTLSTKTDGK